MCAGYHHRDFVEHLREKGIAPHIARCTVVFDNPAQKSCPAVSFSDESFEQWSRYSHRDALDLCVFVQCGNALLPAVAAHLVTADWRFHAAGPILIHIDLASF